MNATPQENLSNDIEIKWDGTGGIPWLHIPSFYPSGLPSSDEDSFLSNFFQLSSIKKSDIIEVNTSTGLYFLNKNFYSWIQKEIYHDGQQLEVILLTYFKSQIEKSLSISSIGVSAKGAQSTTRIDDYDSEEEGGRGKKGGKKGKKGKNSDDNEPQQQQSQQSQSKGSGKKSNSSNIDNNNSSNNNNKKKNSSQKGNNSDKSNQHSSSTSFTNNPSNNINVVLGPYIEDRRMIGLIRQWCQPIVDFTEGKISSNSLSEDSSVDENSVSIDNDEIQSLYLAIWELIKDSTLDMYKKIANKAKDEAAQVYSFI